MYIAINKNKSVSIYYQIYEAIKGKILDGELTYGRKLPSERQLAKICDVNRSTVKTAYDLLKSEAFINSTSGKGTFVVYRPLSNKGKYKESIYDWSSVYHQKLNIHHDSIIQVIMDTEKRGNNNFLAGGLPSDNLIPNQAFRSIGEKLLSREDINVLSHSPVSGIAALKTQLKDVTSRYGMTTSKQNIMITSGSQQALDLIFRAFISKDDIVLVENPSFFGALELFKHYGAKVIPIPIESDGINMEILEYMIQQHQPRLIYTIPTYHNPTGYSMSLGKRKRMVELANIYQVAIVEDDPYREINFSQNHLPTLYSLDTSNHVIYVSTFSKTVALGTRIGWIVGPREVLDCLEKVKQISDLHVNTLNQYILAEFIRSGLYYQHLKKINLVYQKKQDLMIHYLTSLFDDITMIVPEGGYYIWIKFDSSINSKVLYECCSELGTIITPGYHFTSDNQSLSSHIRLNYTYPSNQEIIKGIKTLHQCYMDIKEKHQ